MYATSEKLASVKRQPADHGTHGQAGWSQGSKRRQTPEENGANKRRGAESGEPIVAQPISVLQPRFGLFVDGVVRGTKCRFLVDSGSTETLISRSVYQEIAKERRPVLETAVTNVQQIDGSPLSVMGVAWVDVQVGKTTYPVKAIFADMKCCRLVGS